MRGVTEQNEADELEGGISTRTPHAGSDGNARDGGSLRGEDFNPHSPCGE